VSAAGYEHCPMAAPCQLPDAAGLRALGRG